MADQGTFTFRVSPSVSKYQIKQAIETQFGVDVVSVNTIKHASRTVRSRRTGHYQSVSAFKKALVKLKPKQTIDLFNIKK